MDQVKKVRLDTALVTRGLCSSRTEAKELIEKGLVAVNGQVATKPSKTIGENDEISLLGKRSFVSRGGEKLEGVLLDVFGSKEKIKSFLSGKRALDVGASTGGFTDCLLSYGVSHIDAVDVGTSQFHASLQHDARIDLFEKQDIRTFKGGTYDIIVVDVSFISVVNIIDYVLALGNTKTMYFILVKPQFEVGKGNTKKGIVRDAELAKETALSIAEKIQRIISSSHVNIYDCLIKGGDGNQEYFLCIANKN